MIVTSRKEELILKFREVHGERYGYDNMVYINARTRIAIQCSVHGGFEQFIGNHLKGHGCQKCYFADQVFKQTEVIKQFQSVHGNRYDYSNSIYEGMIKKISIRCPAHGVFEQKAQDHLNGATCMGCYKEDLEKKRIEKKNKILSICAQLYGDRYDYSDSVYISNEVKFTVKCMEHGDFDITPRSHILGAMCPKCKKEDKKWKQLVKANRLKLTE